MRCNQNGFRAGLKSNDWCPNKKVGHRQREGHVKTEAEDGIMPLGGKEQQAPPEMGRGKKGVSPRAFRGS